MKRIAFLTSSIYSSQALHPVARYLEGHGYATHWISHRAAERDWLLHAGVERERVLDTLPVGALPALDAAAQARLEALDAVGGPRVNDIILMDRILRRHPPEIAYRYLAYAAGVISEFLERHGVQVVSNGRDSALQVLTMLVCRQLGIQNAVPSLVRLPRERWGIATGHDDSALVPLREVSVEDVAIAETFVDEFFAAQVAPVAWQSAMNWGAVLRRLPDHLVMLRRELAFARADAGNTFSRYALTDFARMYVRKRWNLLRFRSGDPTRAPGTKPYLLYPMHMQPESTVDVFGAFHSDQRALITQLARATPASHELYVRIHPSDLDGWNLEFYRSIARLPGVRLIGPGANGRALLQGADLVVTVAGSMALEAGLMQIPAITFSRLFFDTLPSVHYCDAPTRLPALVSELLAARDRKVPRSHIVRCVAEWVGASVPGQIDGYAHPFTAAEMDSYREAFDLLLARQAQPARRDDANGESRPFVQLA